MGLGQNYQNQPNPPHHKPATCLDHVQRCRRILLEKCHHYSSWLECIQLSQHSSPIPKQSKNPEPVAGPVAGLCCCVFCATLRDSTSYSEATSTESRVQFKVLGPVFALWQEMEMAWGFSSCRESGIFLWCGLTTALRHAQHNTLGLDLTTQASKQDQTVFACSGSNQGQSQNVFVCGCTGRCACGCT